MIRKTPSFVAFTTLTLALAAGTVLAWNDAPATTTPASSTPATTPAQPAADQPGDALGGPTIKTPAVALTLVERDADGRVKKLDTNPAEAAVKKLPLSKETRAKVDDVLIAHALAMDNLVTENLELIVKIGTAKDSGNKAEMTKYMQEIWAVSEPMRKRGQLITQLGAVLSKDEADTMRKMVNQYFAERVKEEEARAKETGDKSNMMKFGINEQIHVLGNDIKRAYERVIGQKNKDFEDLVKSLNLTPEQDGKVRAVFLDLAQKNFGKATSGQKAGAILKVVSFLDEDQRKTLYAKLAEYRGQKRPAYDKPTPEKPQQPAPADDMMGEPEKK